MICPSLPQFIYWIDKHCVGLRFPQLPSDNSRTRYNQWDTILFGDGRLRKITPTNIRILYIREVQSQSSPIRRRKNISFLLVVFCAVSLFQNTISSAFVINDRDTHRKTESRYRKKARANIKHIRKGRHHQVSSQSTFHSLSLFIFIQNKVNASRRHII